MKVKHCAFIDVVGSGIRETIGVLWPGDAQLLPVVRQVPLLALERNEPEGGAWARAASFDSILAPDKQTWCKFDVYPTPEARCAVRNPVHTTKLHKDGAFTSCDGSGVRLSDQRVRRHARVAVVSGSFPRVLSL